MDNRLATLLTRGSSLTRAEYRVLAHLTEHPLLVGNISARAGAGDICLHRDDYAAVPEAGLQRL